MAQPNLLFIDTNIWLDFYRARNETGLQLLRRIEKIADKLVVTYQLESEFKKNRQAAIYEGMKQLKEPPQIPSPGIFSDATATRVMTRNLREAGKRAKRLHARLIRALEDPAQHDPIYQVCQRVFQKADDLTLTRDNPIRRSVRRAAYRRLLHGCPPGKRGDTSYGDAFNWEWMVNCAIKQAAGLVIVSRDSDYGITIENKSYINDHLRHEFSDRVSRKRKLLLFTSLSEALKTFDVAVSKQEERAEQELLTHPILTYGGFDPASGLGFSGFYGDFNKSRWTDAQRAYLSTVGAPNAFVDAGVIELLRHAGVELANAATEYAGVNPNEKKEP
jgi:hypothetical protein